MNFSPALQACLLQHNFLTARDVMVATPLDLCELLDLSFSEVQQLLLQVALHVTPPFSTVGKPLRSTICCGACRARHAVQACVTWHRPGRHVHTE
jgi:hypothetical protein